MKRIDITGMRFGLYTAVEYIGNSKWKCVCDCGKISYFRSKTLRLDGVKGCADCIKKKHGMYGTRLHNIWTNMKQRCQNPKHKNYKDYGARGITVCDDWQKSENFIKWSLEHGYSDTLTLDRVDVNKGYSPDNCRWVSNIEQQNNKRSNVVVEIDGKKMTVAEISKKYGISNYLIYARIKRGWTGYDLLKPSKKK